MGNEGYISPIAIHPGITLRENLEILEISQKDFAVRTGLREETISRIIQGKGPITPESALKFERVLGISRDFWVKFQAQYDADILRLKEEERLKTEIRYLADFLCYPELVKMGYVRAARKATEKVEELLRFFSIDSLSLVQETIPVAYRKSAIKEINHGSLAAWLRIGIIEARKIKAKPFNRAKLLKNLDKMRRLTKEKPELYSKKLVELCAECGVVLVYTPALKNTHVNGSTRWIKDKAFVQLSLLYSYADIFWFTFFHEIGHILKHNKSKCFVDLKNGNSSKLEKEADRFAQKKLIPNQNDYKQLASTIDERDWKAKLVTFATAMNIDVGIVAGRLAKETGDWAKFSPLRTRLQFTSK